MICARAILLVGPTGAGKTPLGEYLEANGLWGRRCAHFDFGAQLRAVAAGGIVVPELSAEDLGVIRRSLATGAVLENEQFHIAEKILRGFAGRWRLGEGDCIILNGLPRHVGQAKDVDAVLAVEAVISLECTAEVVYERIRLNSAGDRTGRVDDDVAAIARKLEIFAHRTVPLVERYQWSGIPVHRITIGVLDTPTKIHEWLSSPRAGPAA
ncbi:MAG: nucleoside monophosphate kinase [Planctomycetota bacterium]|nr:nucleoside monophosphate kinase [Planctomycetota bacterium]